MKNATQMIHGAETISVHMQHFPKNTTCHEFWSVVVVATFPDGAEFTTSYPFYKDPTKMLDKPFGRVVPIVEVKTPPQIENETQWWLMTAVPDGVYDQRKLDQLKRPISWSNDTDMSDRVDRENALAELVAEAEDALDATPKATGVEIAVGRVVRAVTQ